MENLARELWLCFVGRVLAPQTRAALLDADHICQRLAGWAQQFAGTQLQGFFKPCAYLESCARQGRKLSAGKNASKL